MHTVNIFLASPFEVNEWRPLIGDLIRRWSDQSEPRGYRLKLLCWEDFMPEFTGVRKQAEYNEQLIKNSNIFVALFKSRCGKYTKEEIDFAKSIGLRSIHFLIINSQYERSLLNKYLQTENIPIANINSFNELAYHLGNIIREYIDTLSKPKPKKSSDDVRNIYATFSKDWTDLEPLIGNAIRSLDYIVDKQMGMRARLLVNGKNNIDLCHYYMGFINSMLHSEGRDEIHHAIDNTSDKKCLSRSILYFKKKDDFLNIDKDINNLLWGKEIFSEDYENVYKVKWHLLIWFLHEALSDVDTHCGLKFEDDWITFMGIPIIPLENLDISFDKNWDENQKLIFLLAEINRRQLIQKCEDLGDGSAPLDFEIITNEINTIEQNRVLVDKLKTDTIDSVKILLKKVESRMNALCMSADNANELFELNKIRERLLDNLLIYDSNVVSNLLSTKLFFTSLYDNFADSMHLDGYNQDKQYLSVVEFADKHNLHSPVIEMQRLNYANYLIRENIPDDAIKYYETARHNLNNFNIDTPLFAQYTVAVYLNYIHSLLQLGLRENALIIIKELDQKFGKWNELHILNYIYDVYAVCIFAAKLRCEEVANLNEGKILLGKIFDKEFYKKVPQELYDDIYYHFPNTLAATLIDTQNEDNILAAINILLHSHKRIEVETKLEPDLKLFHKGEMTHNLALAYNRIGDFPTAIKYAEESLMSREKLYELKNHEENLFHIAETIYIISTIYLYKSPATMDELKRGIKIADKAIEMYSRLNKGYIEQITCIYKAKLAKASIQMRMPETQQAGKELMKECYDWALTHPDSSYRDTIIIEYKLRFPD